MCFLGMLVGLFGEFVGAPMIRFVVTSSIMSVLRKIVKFSRSIVRALWHRLPSGSVRYQAITNCSDWQRTAIAIIN
jgi:hypothetical protein